MHIKNKLISTIGSGVMGHFMPKNGLFRCIFCLKFSLWKNIQKINGFHQGIVRELYFLGNMFFFKLLYPIMCKSASNWRVFKVDVLAPFFQPSVRSRNIWWERLKFLSLNLARPKNAKKFSCRITQLTSIYSKTCHLMPKWRVEKSRFQEKKCFIM